MRVSATTSDEHARVKALLQSIVGGTRVLLDAPEFEPALRNWLAMMGAAQGALRASYYDMAFFEDARDFTLRCLCEWSSIEAEQGCPGGVSFANPVLIDTRGAGDLPRRTHAGETVAYQVDEVTGWLGEALRAQGHATTIVCPIMDQNRCVGAISFDYTERREVNPTDETILRTAADALASVLNRNELQARLIAEQKARADENERLAALLQAIADAARTLIDAAEFEPAIRLFLKAIGEAAGADACICTHGIADRRDGTASQHRFAEWRRREIGREDTTSAPAQRISEPNGVEGHVRGVPDAASQPLQTDNLARGLPLPPRAVATEMRTLVEVPIRLGAQIWGFIGFDFRDHRAMGEREMAVLQTAADLLSSVLRRNETQAVADRERQQREQIERQRADENERLARQLERITRVSRELLAAQSFEDNLPSLIGGLGEAVDADGCSFCQIIFTAKASDASLQLRGDWWRPGKGKALEANFSQPFVLNRDWIADVIDGMISGEQRVIQVADLPQTSPFRQFAERLGVATTVYAVVRLDGALWGFLCFRFCEPRQVNARELAVLQTCADMLASGLRRAMAESLANDEKQKREAVEGELFEEKSRLAREIHDTLAQGYAGVIMQILAAEDALECQDADGAMRHVMRALDRARLGLSEARRSVFTLRPPVLEQGDLPGAVRIMLARVFEGLPVRADLLLEGEPRHLPEEIANETFRIIHEAVNNAIRHARASLVSIRLVFASDGSLNVVVVDNGVGMDVSLARFTSGGFGLVSMAERAQRMGGRLEITSDDGQGVAVLLIVPPARPDQRVSIGDPSAILPLIPADKAP